MATAQRCDVTSARTTRRKDQDTKRSFSLTVSDVTLPRSQLARHSLFPLSDLLGVVSLGVAFGVIIGGSLLFLVCFCSQRYALFQVTDRSTAMHEFIAYNVLLKT